ncbi:hypothetical protein PCASD_18842 [Puccinia coronata f. sp. avenae]|uniref:Uncharacterized protein n=1 Tax=Puccinia coronata f. sp. avenae TaxID=200324 RepID=A0A2N5SG49_9BASI|nr:hypothetical protein PCASD_18842 [Puccinia coronata f. sp. avenae]
MLSTLLSFTLIALSFSSFSQAIPVNSELDALTGRVNPTASNYVAAHPRETKGYDPNIIPGGKIHNPHPPTWKAILVSNTPLYAENLDSWKKTTQSYRDLPSDEQTVMRKWLHHHFDRSFRQSAGIEHLRNYIWSLSQSIREPTEIWWKESLFVEAAGYPQAFFDLVALGDLLGFSRRSVNFNIDEHDVDKVANRIAQILTMNVDDIRSTKCTRTSALPTNLLMKYVDENGVSLYESRMGQLMACLLKHFGRATDDQKVKIMKMLYLFIGFTPEEAETRADTSMYAGNRKVVKALQFNIPKYQYISRLLIDEMVQIPTPQP